MGWEEGGGATRERGRGRGRGAYASRSTSPIRVRSRKTQVDGSWQSDNSERVLRPLMVLHMASDDLPLDMIADFSWLAKRLVLVLERLPTGQSLDSFAGVFVSDLF